MSPTDAGVSHSVTVETLDGSIATPSPDTTCPRNPTSFNQNSHLLNLAYNLCSLSFSHSHCSFHCHCHCHSCYHCGGCGHYGCDHSHHDGCVLHCEHGHSHHCGYVHGYVLHCQH